MLANAEAIPSHKVLEGKRMTAVFKFIPDTSEELSIEVGDVITIVEVFDDGWVKGRKSNEQERVFPLAVIGIKP